MNVTIHINTDASTRENDEDYIIDNLESLIKEIRARNELQSYSKYTPLQDTNGDRMGWMVKA